MRLSPIHFQPWKQVDTTRHLRKTLLEICHCKKLIEAVCIRPSALLQHTESLCLLLDSIREAAVTIYAACRGLTGVPSHL
jgi:hypothetical protein